MVDKRSSGSLFIVVLSLLTLLPAMSTASTLATTPLVSGHITEYRIPTVNSSPRFITTGLDGNYWFVEEQGNKIGVITNS